MDTKRLAQLQRDLAGQVVLEDRFGSLRTIAGCDVSLRRSRKSTDGAAAIVLMSLPDFQETEVAVAPGRVEFPYVPGFLSFRELPLLKEAFSRLSAPPDLMIVDGSGLIHPRRIGLACHVGVELDVPTIGCAKSLLCGKYEEFPLKRGRRSPVVHDGETLGYAVCTRDGVKPVFISPGHRVGFESAVEIILQATPRYRLPEPVRLAHKHSRQALTL